MPFANAWDETYPPGTLSADQINEAIIYWSIAIRERMNSVLGIADWATAVQPLMPSFLTFRGASPLIVGGTVSFLFRDNANVNTNVTIAEVGDLTTRRNLIASNNLISNTNLVFNANSAKILPGAVSLLFRDFADANTNFSILDNGAVTIRGGLTSIGASNQLGASSFSSAVISGGQGSIARLDDGNVGGAVTVNWALSNNQRVRLTSNTTFTFTNPVAGAFYFLEVQQDGTGSRLVIWPGTVLWPSSSAPAVSTAINKIDTVCFYYNGTNYLGGAAGFAY